MVNQRVHVLARGCLTLKLLGSWKTVTMSDVPFEVSAPLVPSVGRGLLGIATSAMIAELRLLSLQKVVG